MLAKGVLGVHREATGGGGRCNFQGIRRRQGVALANAMGVLVRRDILRLKTAGYPF